MKTSFFSFLLIAGALLWVIVHTQPLPVWAVPPTDQNWNLVFSDEFEGTTLDTNKWEPSWFKGNAISVPINSDEVGCYDPNQVSVSGGTLKLAAVTTTNPNCKDRSGSAADYASGLVNTRENFTFSYGYMEARLYLPGQNGAVWNWPAFWTDGTGNWPATGEIDVVEGLEDGDLCWHYHYRDQNGSHQGPGGCANLADPTGWHTFAARWQPGSITYYYDGNQVGVISEGVVNSPHFVVLNYGVNPDFGIHVPATMEVDYVRVWQVSASPTPSPSTTPSPTPSATPTPTASPSPSPSPTASPVPDFCAADINQSGMIDLVDYTLLANNFMKTGNAINPTRADINQSGTVDIVDYSLLSTKFMQACGAG